MNLTIELTQESDEPGWFVRVKELPGCVSQGKQKQKCPLGH